MRKSRSRSAEAVKKVLTLKEMAPVIPYKFQLIRKCHLDKPHILSSLDEYYYHVMRENKVKSRMFIQLQPSEPFSENTVTIVWKDTSDNFVADLEVIHRMQEDQYQLYTQVKTAITSNQYSGKEDVLLSLLSQVDPRFIRQRSDYQAIKANLDQYKIVLTESKQKNRGLMKHIAQQVAQIEKSSIPEHPSYYQDRDHRSGDSDYYRRYENYGSQNPRRFQNRGPKSYPCKYFHGTRGCSLGESCSFIHEEQFKGTRIPFSEMERIITEHQDNYHKSIQVVQVQIESQFQRYSKAMEQQQQQQQIPSSREYLQAQTQLLFQKPAERVDPLDLLKQLLPANQDKL